MNTLFALLAAAFLTIAFVSLSIVFFVLNGFYPIIFKAVILVLAGAAILFLSKYGSLK